MDFILTMNLTNYVNFNEFERIIRLKHKEETTRGRI